LKTETDEADRYKRMYEEEHSRYNVAEKEIMGYKRKIMELERPQKDTSGD
jgi:hypothetical protein